MKTFPKQKNKWLLSTLLVAALGSQYYFSVSSKSMGSVEMSSVAEELALKLEQLKHTPDIKAPEFEKRRKEIIAEYESKFVAEKTKLETAEALKITAKTEAKTVQILCADCGEGGVTVTGSEKAIADIAAQLGKKKTETVATVAKVEVVAKEDKFETAKERREREKEERDDAKAEVKRKKEIAKDEKNDKLLEDKITRNEEFVEKAEEIAEKCQDNLSCKVNRITSLLGRYTGKKKIDMFVVTKAYNQYIDKDLKAGLRGEDGSEGKTGALEALAALTGSIPAEYKSLKTRSVDSAKAAQTSQALAVNGLFKQADLYTKQNKLNEALLSRDQGLKAEAVFRQDAEVIYQSMYTGLNSTKDLTTMDYVRNNYVPDVTKLLNQLTNTTASIGQTVNTSSTSTRVGRGGSTIVNGTTIQNSNDSLSTVQFSPATPNRAVNRTGINLKQ